MCTRYRYINATDKDTNSTYQKHYLYSTQKKMNYAIQYYCLCVCGNICLLPRILENVHLPRISTYLMFSNLLESGFRVVECFPILYMVMTRKMRLSCQNRGTARLTHQTGARNSFPGMSSNARRLHFMVTQTRPGWFVHKQANTFNKQRVVYVFSDSLRSYNNNTTLLCYTKRDMKLSIFKTDSQK